MRITTLPPVLCLSVLMGCTDSADSAASNRLDGIAPDKLVANAPQGAWTAEEAWTVEPVLSLGGLDADPEYQFGEVSGVDVDGAGNIYVADKQAQHVRVFSPSGELLRVIGRPGEGPGEFGAYIGGVFSIGNEIVVPDVSSRRVSYFDLEGAFLRSERFDVERGIPIRWDVAAGRLVAQRRLIVPGDQTASTGDVVVTLAPDAQQVDTILQLPLGQSVQVTGGLPKIVQFMPEPVWDAAPDGRVAVAMTDAFELEVHSPAGELEWVASIPSPDVPVRDSHRRAVEQSFREMYRTQGIPPNVSEEVIARMEFADRLPVVADIMFGPRDTLWVREFTPPDEFADDRVRVSVQDMGALNWRVLDSTGRYLGDVSFPVDFRPTRVIGDRFYGVSRDELDVPTVQVFRVVTE